MKAVNLMPAGERRSSSAPGVYALLGALAVVLVLISAYALLSKSVSDKRAQVSSVKRQADAAEAVARELSPYTEFAALRRERAQAIAKLAGERLDWAHTLREIARTIPANSQLTSLHGGAANGAQGATPSAGPGDSSTAAAPQPTVELGGCAAGGQDGVARFMVDLRRIDGVERVQLKSSAKSGGTGGGASSPSAGASAGSSAGCGDDAAQFQMTLYLRAQGASAAPAAQPPTGGTTP
jgi:Tfp pilus assembly protein PilN